MSNDGIDYKAFLCGLTAGTLQAAVFNPFDRALYLSVKNQTHFLSPANFTSPYQGFLQTVGGRALSGGLYYPLEHLFMTYVPTDAGPWANFCVGTGAGLANAIILNPTAAVRYKTWGRDVNRGMLTEVSSMWRKGRIRPFTNGLTPTIWRDVIFGGCYTFLRLELQYHGLPPEKQWLGNILAASVATIASGPFNLARNEQYATKSRQTAPSIQQVFRVLYQQVSSFPTYAEKWNHLQNRLRIGWGTARVAVGIAFGHWFYDEMMWAIEMHEAGLKEKPKLRQERRPTLVSYRTKEFLHRYDSEDM